MSDIVRLSSLCGCVSLLCLSLLCLSDPPSCRPSLTLTHIVLRRRLALVPHTSPAPRSLSLWSYINCGGAWQWFGPVLSFINRHDVRLWSYINCDWDAFPMWQVAAHGIPAPPVS